MFIYNKNKLKYEKVGFGWLLSTILTSCFLGLVIGVNLSSGYTNNFVYGGYDILRFKEDITPSNNKFFLDSVFTDYEKRADVYLSRGIFKGTPISSEMLTLCAKNTYDSTGIIVPIELVLIQAQFESSMGREGRSPKRNPFNLGESTKRTTLWFETTFDGVQAYYYLMANKYLKCKSVEELLLDFTRCDGKRYAENPNYENLISSEYLRIKRWIDNNI